MREPKACEICGEMFTPRDSRQRACASEECKRLLHRKIQREYEKTHPKRNSNRYKKMKFEQRVKHEDTIIGEGYAERQIADSLRIAGKVRVEL